VQVKGKQSLAMWSMPTQEVVLAQLQGQQPKRSRKKEHKESEVIFKAGCLQVTPYESPAMQARGGEGSSSVLGEAESVPNSIPLSCASEGRQKKQKPSSALKRKL
jgi:hypothetical protein